jgi:hypothetical protein
MKTCENWLEFYRVALAALSVCEHSLYQGWHSWRRTGDVATNFMTTMGGRDRLDRSVRLTDGPNLLARPNFVAVAVGQHR